MYQQERASPPDFVVSQNPSDSVSSLLYNPVHDVLAAGSWDGSTYIYAPSAASSLGTAVLKTSIPNPNSAPVLSMAYSQDGLFLVTGSTDGCIRVIDMNTGSTTELQAHDSPVSAMAFTSGQMGNQLLVTGGWDKKLKFWDMKSGAPVNETQMEERVYSVDSKGSIIGIIMAGNKVSVLDSYTLTPLQGISYSRPASGRFARSSGYSAPSYSNTGYGIKTRLNWQARTIACFNDGSGVAIGGIEGKVDMIAVKPGDKESWFIFKCHRKEKEVFPINKIATHPIYSTLATCGGDGTYSIWDKQTKTRTKTGGPGGRQAITTGCFDRTGKFFAYATGYDWSRGYVSNIEIPVEIRISALSEKEVKDGAQRK